MADTKTYDIALSHGEFFKVGSYLSKFEQDFETINDRQQEEIAYLKERHPDIQIDKIMGSPIEKLLQTDAILNQINSNIICIQVEKQKGKKLNLDNIGITRFIIPENCKEYFSALEELLCSHNQLMELNLEWCSALQYLDCSHNKITTLNLERGFVLQWVWCSYNQLSALILTKCKNIQSLHCNHNRLTTLNLEGCVALEDLFCNNNKLTDLSLKDLIKLKTLFCGQNLLSSLNFQNSPKVKLIYCEGNLFTTHCLQGNDNLKYLIQDFVFKISLDSNTEGGSQYNQEQASAPSDEIFSEVNHALLFSQVSGDLNTKSSINNDVSVNKRKLIHC